MSQHSTNSINRQLISRVETFLRSGIPGLCILGLIMTVATPAQTAVKTTPYQEFVKALNIVDQTQLTIFTDEQPPDKDETIAIYKSRLENVKQQLDSNAPDYESELEVKRIQLMRQILADTIEQYNDQYANYISPDALKKYNARRNGNFVGVGLKFRAVKDEHPLAIGPLQGGPMADKDIEPGDKLISVDGTSLFKLTSSEVVKALKGPANSVASLTVSRNGKEHTLEINRASVDLHYTDAELLNKTVGYIKISRFGSKTHLRVEKLLDELLSQGAQSIILDLRDNPGGSTRAARAIVSMFSIEEDVYCERYKTGAVKKLPRYGDHKTDLPLAVLINNESMSSSEIVAGAIQSNERGIIIGSPSYGKGLVQKIFNLQAPLGGAVRTTIAVFGRPDHQIIHGAGIVPDYYIQTDSDFMFRRTGSLNIADDARAFQRTLLERDVRKKYPVKADEIISAPDLQLQTAINKLQVTISSTQ